MTRSQTRKPALSLDPGNFTLRSCAFTFEQLGNYARGAEFLQLDAGSAWASANLARQYIRAGKLADAREVAQKFSDMRWNRMIVACVDNPSSENAIKMARDEAAEVLADPDPEVHYAVAPDFLVCGQKDLMLKLLKTSIDGHYCSYTGLQNDSVWAKLRGTAEFEAIVREAKQCQDDFRAEIAKGQ